LYIGVMFVLVPLIFLGISAIFEEDSKGLTVLGSFITIILALVLFWLAYWCQFKGGRESCGDCMGNRERKRLVMEELPDDMVYLKAKMAALIEHTGLPLDEEGDAEAVKADEEDEEVEA